MVSEIIGLANKLTDKNKTKIIRNDAKIMPMQTGTSNLLNSLIKIQMNKIWTRDDQILNFISCDMV